MPDTTAPLAAELAAGPFRHLDAGGPPRIGAEVEAIPVDADRGTRIPVEGPDGRSTMGILRPLAAARGWRERRTAKGTPAFHLPNGGTVTFEPGGQLEVSSPPGRTAADLLARMRDAVGAIEAAALDAGVVLLFQGIDPIHSVEEVPLMVSCERYRRMTAYFEGIGPAGVRMMRQTATFHLNLDLGGDLAARWHLLNAAAPVLLAMFANSAVYARRATGCASFRAETWRTLDWSRTGLADRGGTPETDYLHFALEAPAILLGAVEGEYQPFSWWWESGRVGLEAWHQHLSTLFPEIRPRGYFEVRSMDSLPPRWFAAPVALLAGLTYDAEAAGAAAEVLGPARTALLHIAGVRGLADHRLARMARELVAIAMTGCRRLGADYLPPGEMEAAEEFFDRYTLRGRSPADDQTPERPRSAVGGVG